MTNEMIERVAKAMMEASTTVGHSSWSDIARAAIEAMREPTEAMIEHADANAFGGVAPGEPLYHGAKNTWQHMIDAALSDAAKKDR